MAAKSVSKVVNVKQTANAKELAQRADKALSGMAQPLMAVREMGQKMKDCPFIGWTIRECILSLIARIKTNSGLMPTPTDQKAAKLVRALLREGQAALDDLEDGANLLGADFDCGMKHGDGAAAFGAAFESFANKAGSAFEEAAGLMGVDDVMFCFYDSREKEREAA